MFRVVMNSRFLLPILVMAALLAGCAEPRNPEGAVARARLIGGSFASYGTVAFHRGQPCASQIMYDFRGAGPTTHGRSVARSTVWLAAPMHETRLLAEAANCNCPVRVSGKWRRALDRGCSYVEVRSVEMMR